MNAERDTTTTTPTPATPTLCLALRPKDAAKALGIGTRLLWNLTVTGEVPHCKLGRCIVYPVDALRDYLNAAAAKEGRR